MTHDLPIDKWAEVLTPRQYGTSMHFPDCRYGQCTGCLPPVNELLLHEQDPVVKHDGAGQPVRASDHSLGNRAERRRLAREARRRR